MTYQEQVEIAKSCSSAAELTQKCDYRLGREAAMEDIANGEPNLAEHFAHLREVLGEAWTKGYTDYYNAWNILNQT